MGATVNTMVQGHTQFAINSIAVERALSAAREAMKGETPNAWSAAGEIANACNVLAATGSSKAAIFAIAAKQASEAFEKARKAAGALTDEAKWGAFSSAASVARGALEFNIWVSDMGKSEAAKAVKSSREAAANSALQAAIDAGIVPAQSTPESEAAALRTELFFMKSDLDLVKGALQVAQERLIPIDAAKRAFDISIAEMRAQLDAAYLEMGALRALAEKSNALQGALDEAHATIKSLKARKAAKA